MTLPACVVCGQPGLIHWTPFYLDAAGELIPTDGGSFGQTALCDPHFQSLIAAVRNWLAQVRSGT